MGDAKRRRLASTIVYHHTSTLRTNLLWMSGVIEVEGRGGEPLHPDLGFIKNDVGMRRAMEDFPPVAWFTSNIKTPACLLESALILIDKDTGKTLGSFKPSEALAQGFALKRVAIGFPAEAIPIIPWPSYEGFSTQEGRALNQSARELGDDPNEWWVSEKAVDLTAMTRLYVAESMESPRLVRQDAYMADVHRLIKKCRSTKTYVPPTWFTQKQEKIFAAASKVMVRKIL